MVTIRSPFCGYNTIWCVELNGEDLSCYSNKTEWASLRKCSYNHWLTDKAYLSVFITVTNIYQSFTYKMAAKINWHRYGAKLSRCLPMYFCACHQAYLWNCTPKIFDKFSFLHVLPICNRGSVRSTCGAVAICYIFPVLLMTSYNLCR